jgi:hypothetical protein
VTDLVTAKLPVAGPMIISPFLLVVDNRWQVDIVIAAEDGRSQVAAHIHVAAICIRAGGVGTICGTPPVAGGDLLRALAVEIRRKTIADEAAACYGGPPTVVSWL